MTDNPSKDAADEARDMREHEREAQKRASHEESPLGEDEAGIAPGTADDLDPDDQDKSAPPGIGRGTPTG